MSIKNKVQLITYPDSMGGDLKNLNHVLTKYFKDTFKGGIHILPPFPSSGDRGFAPLTYLEIEPSFGSWDDIAEIAKNFDIMLDLMVNHISRQSAFFQDYLEKGSESEYADLFLTMGKIWPDQEPSKDEIEKIFLRRNEPYSVFEVGPEKEEVKVWTTFGKQTPSEQIDMDVNSKVFKDLLKEFFSQFEKYGVKFVRLDAVGYMIKKPGTSCFFVEPEIYEVMGEIRDMAKAKNIDLLPEVHAHYTTQYSLSENGYWIYDFILPYTVLSALIHRSNKDLLQYLENRPEKQFTMLDCHDGVPVKPDLDDLVSSTEARKIVDIALERGSNLSKIYSSKHRDADGFDVHQIPCSYYSVLDCNDDAYIAARAIQFFVPGIPQVYYVGLLAGKNDEKAVQESGDGRGINRHNYSLEEIDEAMNNAVVKRLMKLIEFRNSYEAFNGTFTSLPSNDDEIILSWKKDHWSCTLDINLSDYQTWIEYQDQSNELKRIKL